MSKKKKEYRIENRPRTIYRVVKSAQNPFVMIDRRPIDNPALSYKAKGILTYLMSRPDGWEVSVADLIHKATDGDDSVRSGLKELRDAGHMKYTKMRERGRITGWLIEVYEVPHADFQDVALPDVALPDVEKPTQVLKNLNRTESKKKEDREIVVDFPFLEVESVSKYWHEIAEKKTSRTLQAVLKRLFVTGDKYHVSKGQIKSDVIGLMDRTVLQSPYFPENYMVACVNTLQDAYLRYGKEGGEETRVGNHKTKKQSQNRQEPKGFEAGRKFLERHGIKLDEKTGSHNEKIIKRVAADQTAYEAKVAEINRRRKTKQQNQ